MYKICVSVILILSIASLIELSASQCSQPSHCEAGECCVIGMMRYAIPSCQKLLQEGDSCRVGNEPSNGTYAYPNGLKLETNNIYTVLCPCDVSLGLSCVKGECVKDDTNHV